QYGSLRSSQYYDENGVALAFRSLDLTIDQSTGLVRESRDMAGLVTLYERDEMGRLTWVKPEVGHGAWIQYVYTRATSSTAPAKVEILHRPNGSETATALARSAIHFESFGRVWKEQRLMPGVGWSSRETRYNGMGWKSQVSEYSADTPAGWTRYLDYDPFGRPRTIRPPDGAGHDVAICYTGVRLVERTTKVGSARDAAGQIVETESTTT
ncbi:MAG: hypothetical protein GY867_00600, partial [bacterium]|nr:hypothetical protein [bacterium]